LAESVAEYDIQHVTVFLYRNNVSTALIEYAARFAAQYGAILKGVYVKAWRPFPQGDSQRLPVDYRDWVESEVHESATRARENLQQECRRLNVRSQWFESTGDPVSIGREHIQCTDIALIGQPGGADGAFERYTTNEIILDSGRPVVIVPKNGWQGSIASNVVIAWDAGVAATRAVHSAMPILRYRDPKVSIADLFSSDKVQKSQHQLRNHLNHHGIDAEIYAVPPALRSRGNALIEDSIERGIDLIVMGVWGHSRAREYIFGGVSRTLLHSSSIPIYTSH